MRSCKVVAGPAAIIEGRAALVLYHVLSRELRNRTPLPVLLKEMRLQPRDREASLAAFELLEEVGESWRLSRLPQCGNAATGGTGPGVACESMTSSFVVGVCEAAALLGLGERRTRGLAQVGALDAVKTSRGWSFNRDAVVAYSAARHRP